MYKDVHFYVFVDFFFYQFISVIFNFILMWSQTVSELVKFCYGLNEDGHMNAWFPVGGAVWEG